MFCELSYEYVDTLPILLDITVCFVLPSIL